MGSFFLSLGCAAAAVAVTLAVTLVVALRIGRHNVIDATWGLLFCVIATVVFLTSFGHGDGLRRVLLLAMVWLWGGRLAVHIGRRSRGKGEDPRYQQLLGRAPGNRTWYAIRMIYALQGLLALLISVPVQVGMHEDGGVFVLGWLGVVVWAVGLFFEATGDAQMSRFRADPANRGKLIDVGLWRYTRHPNYFGDATVWTGLWLVAAERWPGVLTLPSVAIMIYLLVFGSGKRLLERSMMDRPGYREYARRTSGFFPLPPRKTAAG
jgi:steroid 5-alpha reductase family enzyme